MQRKNQRRNQPTTKTGSGGEMAIRWYDEDGKETPEPEGARISEWDSELPWGWDEPAKDEKDVKIGRLEESVDFWVGTSEELMAEVRDYQDMVSELITQNEALLDLLDDKD